MTKTLTEQYNDWTLQDGNYYTICYKGWSGDTFPCILYISKHNGATANVKEVLAPVPSYEEYKELVRKSDKLDKIMYDSATNQGDCQQIVEDNLNRQIERLEKQLAIATKALKEYERCENGSFAHKALHLIEEVK